MGSLSLRKMSSHATLQGTLGHSCHSSLRVSHYGVILAYKVQLVGTSWIPILKNKERRWGMNHQACPQDHRKQQQKNKNKKKAIKFIFLVHFDLVELKFCMIANFLSHFRHHPVSPPPPTDSFSFVFLYPPLSLHSTSLT